jgi:hypothetical protein
VVTTILPVAANSAGWAAGEDFFLPTVKTHMGKMWEKRQHLAQVQIKPWFHCSPGMLTAS